MPYNLKMIRSHLIIFQRRANGIFQSKKMTKFSKICMYIVHLEKGHREKYFEKR